ncbi:MAG: hypothetical protein FWG84_06575 [Bacteroidales bacterium]|nr:hypothetical protein [Bacteroidales bacterium]
MKKVNIIRKSMSKVLSLIPVSLLVGGAIVVSFLFATGCKKGTNCPDGYDHSIMKSPPKSAMAAKSSDQCEFEWNEYQKADSLLTYVYHPDVRNAIGPATNGIEAEVWGRFQGYFEQPYDPSNFTITDTVKGVRYAIRVLWKDYDNPLPINGDEIQILYDFCGTDSIGYDVMQEKYGAWYDCDNGVGITEYEWVKDDCGGYWTVK